MSSIHRARSRARTLAAIAVCAYQDIGDVLAEVGLLHRFHFAGLGQFVDAIRPECVPRAASHRTQGTADGHDPGSSTPRHA